MEKFAEWLARVEEWEIFELVDMVNNLLFEDHAWELLDWWEIDYDRDEVRAWALTYGEDEDEVGE